MSEYRIKYLIGRGYFAQRRTKLLGIWPRWQTIGAHVGENFGLYPENDIKYPMETAKEAKERIERYIKRLEYDTAKPLYHDYRLADEYMGSYKEEEDEAGSNR